LIIYKKSTDFFYICQRIVQSCFFEIENQKQIRETFLAINTSDSGEISFEELKAALPELSEDEIFNILLNVCQSVDIEDKEKIILQNSIKSN
jgi:hypothetical protein